uniref:Transcription initiation factor IIF subunit alpha n=1 Tax=Callorhinchus milii TaxID=7868 RepID=A0A4W3GZV2_CALMI
MGGGGLVRGLGGEGAGLRWWGGEGLRGRESTCKDGGVRGWVGARMGMRGVREGDLTSCFSSDSSDESESSDESDIETEAASALFMLKKKTPPKKERKGSNSSSRGTSRPSTPTTDPSLTSSTLKAAANRLEQGKRQGGSAETPAAKRLKMDAAQSSSGKSTPQPQSGKSTPSSGDIQLTEDAVRRYLTRKPMTTKDLLKKFQTKKTGLSSEQTVNVLAQILKKLNPERKMINDKMHFFLKEAN